MRLHIADLLRTAAIVNPHGVAATLRDDRMTFAELDANADRLAAALATAGMKAGDTVAWWSSPSLTSIAGFAAAARAGAVFTSLNPALADQEAAAALGYLEPRLLVAGGPLAEKAAEIFDGESVSVDPAGSSPLPLLGDAAGGPGDTPPVWTDFDETDAHIVYLTSGTTGTPKGVVVSHRASWLRAFPGGSTFADGLRGRGGILAAFPLFHYGGWHFVLEAWQHGCAFHMCDRFDGETIASVASKQRPSAMYCIPALWERLLDTAGQDDLASVLHADTGTSAAPPDLIARIKRHLPQATTSVLYGSSEGGHHTTLFDWDLEGHPGSVGRAAPPGAVRIDRTGEILYRSPTLMSGYLNRPDETREALRDGWYHTGDLGVMDGDGYLYITGRLREVIRTGGETVSPSEVEAALRSFPGVEDLAVVGLADGTWGEIVTAAVVCAPGITTPGVSELRDHLGDKLAAFKHPRAVIAIERIPRTPATGQVQRTLLVDELTRLSPQRRNT